MSPTRKAILNVEGTKDIVAADVGSSFSVGIRVKTLKSHIDGIAGIEVCNF